jgi:hypothetical protein
VSAGVGAPADTGRLAALVRSVLVMVAAAALPARPRTAEVIAIAHRNPDLSSLRQGKL